VSVERLRLDDINTIPSGLPVEQLLPSNGATASRNGKRPPRRVLATAAAQVERSQVEWLDPGRVPVGQVTVLAGVGGLGKSQWTCLLAGRLSRGELGEPAVSLIATAEDDPSTTVRPRLEAVQADLERVQFLTIATSEGDEDGIAIPDDVPQLEQTVRELGARLVVIDPLVAHLPEKIDSHRDQSVRRALAPLYRLAKNTDCAVCVILHLNKSTGLAPLMRLGGSGAFGNAARSVLLLDRDPDDVDGERGNQRVLAHIKCNVAPSAPSLLYKVAPIVLPAEGNAPMVETSRLELLGESEHSGTSLLTVADEDERSAIEEAVEFLRDFLADGTRQRANEIYKEAKALHIHDRTLHKASRRLGVKREKAGFTRGWEWWLPEGERREADESANPHSSTKAREGACYPDRSPSVSTEDDHHLAYLDEGERLEPPREGVTFGDQDDIPF
jgi:putative DNA primase/helicase